MVRGATSGYGCGDAERCGVRGPNGRDGAGWSDCIVSDSEDDGRGSEACNGFLCSSKRLYKDQRPRGRDHTLGSRIAARPSKMPTTDQPATDIVARYLSTPTRMHTVTEVRESPYSLGIDTRCADHMQLLYTILGLDPILRIDRTYRTNTGWKLTTPGTLSSGSSP